jgi:NADH-ubiquinone oxidoreductase chain 6
MYIFNEYFINGFQTITLDILSLFSILCAISVIIIKNPIISVLFLIGLFLSIASYLIILGISFIGLSYLLVYVGAVSILFLFILMLINVRVSELLNETSNSIPLAIIIGMCFIHYTYQILPSNFVKLNTINFNNNIKDIIFNFNYIDFFNNSNSVISFVTSNSWDGTLTESTHINSIGSIMYSSYSIWLILTSIILLLAMVGTIVITIKQKLYV